LKSRGSFFIEGGGDFVKAAVSSIFISKKKAPSLIPIPGVVPIAELQEILSPDLISFVILSYD